MVFLRFGAFAVATSLLASAHESSPLFAGTSPFFLFSNFNLQTDALRGKQLALSEDVQTSIKDILSSCESKKYYVVNQPGVDASDFQQGKTPYLSKRFAGERKTATSAAIPQVQGHICGDNVSAMIAKACKATPMTVDYAAEDVALDSTVPGPWVVTVNFPNPPQNQDRGIQLAAYDNFLDNLITIGGSSESHTLIYTTSPPRDATGSAPHPEATYEMDDAFQDAQHIELKRDVGSRDVNSTLDTNLPLFEKYQFLSPAIFMGGIVVLFFILLTYVAITAVSSVQVSYFAFSKEMGPSAQKKQ